MSEFPAAQITAVISRAETPGEFHAGLRIGLDFLDQLNVQTIAASGLHLACRAGCSICCSLRVDVFAHEVFLIADHVRAHFTPEELVQLLDRLAQHSATVLPLTPFEHATQNVECPLLAPDGRCSVYELRPHACRRHHSLDLSACQFCYDHPTDLEFPAAHDIPLFRSLTEVMQRGIDTYAELGFDHTIYELGTALAEALRDPERWNRWASRERAFLSASVTESSPNRG